MSDLTFDQFRLANVMRNIEVWADADWTPSDWGIATAGELGEALNLIKKQRRGDVIPLDDIAMELADTQTCLDLLANSLGIDLGEATRRKFNIVSERVGSRTRL